VDIKQRSVQAPSGYSSAASGNLEEQGILPETRLKSAISSRSIFTSARCETLWIMSIRRVAESVGEAATIPQIAGRSRQSKRNGGGWRHNSWISLRPPPDGVALDELEAQTR